VYFWHVTCCKLHQRALRVPSSPAASAEKENAQMLGTLLIILLILLLLGAVPVWPYSRSWGYYPSGGLGLVLLIIIILLLTGRI
jgi:hypothetical protein